MWFPTFQLAYYTLQNGELLHWSTDIGGMVVMVRGHKLLNDRKLRKRPTLHNKVKNVVFIGVLNVLTTDIEL